MQPDEPNDEERLEALPQDGQTPFQPADPNPSPASDDPSDSDNPLPDDHPATDTNIDPMELYDEGVSGAAEAEDTSGQSAVGSYTPDDDDSGDDV